MSYRTRSLIVAAALAVCSVPAAATAAVSEGAGTGPRARARDAWLTAKVETAMANRTITSSGQTPVMGAAALDADQIAAWYRSKGHTPRIPGVQGSVRRLAQLFIEEGAADGVRGDVAFAQSMLETGWLTFPSYGQIRPEFNNFSGIFAFDGRANGEGCDAGESRCFPTARMGVRYQIQLLRSYADPAVASGEDRLINAPRDRRGIAPNWERFGGCPSPLVWASACGYGPLIVQIYRGGLSYSGLTAECIAPLTRRGTAGAGYWLAQEGGRVRGFGNATDRGDVTSAAPIVGGETGSGGGYYLLASDGAVHAVGAPHYGDPTPSERTWVAMERTRRGYGYWLLTNDGRVFEFGRAQFYGSPRADGADIDDAVGIERTFTGEGYWVITASGEVYAYGDAVDHGSPPATGSPVVGMARTPTGLGYWTVRANGRVDEWGDARPLADLFGCTGNDRARAIVPTRTRGYWILTSGGQVHAYGDAAHFGQLVRPLTPAVAIIRSS